MVFNYLLGILIAVTALIALSRFIDKKTFSVIRKISAITLAVAAFFRCMIEHEAIFDVRGLNMYSPFGEDIPRTVVSIFLVWFTYSALLSIVLDQFFDFPNLKNLTRYFSAPILMVDLVFFNTYSTAIIGSTAFKQFDFRLPLIATEITLGLFLVYSQMRKNGHLIPVGKEWLSLIASVPLSLFAIMPSYVPQALLGWDKNGLTLRGFTEEHRIAIYLAILLPFVLFHILKDKKDDVKRLFLIYLSVGMLWSFLTTHPVSAWLEPWRWPLHLCSLAMFTVPLSLIFKWDKLCYFGLYVSVVGALFMMLFPNTDPSANAFSTAHIAFWINHYAVFSLPLLIVSLKIFKRPRFKDFLTSTAIFTGYFIIVLILNAWFINYFDDVDFFFLNGNYIVDMLGEWAVNIKSIEWSIPLGDITLTFYPLYQLLFYIVYVTVSAVMWICFRFLFGIWDNAESRRLKERDYKKMRSDLKKFLAERADSDNAHKDVAPGIVLRAFSKKYGKNKHYSVDHVSFSVRGGEIFGFLGPNGAGKSTIIKSIVGIQTITSGNIEICGYDVERQSVQAKLNTGFVPDHYALYENLTGREYINYIADLYDVDKATREETIEKYVTRFQLTGSFDNQMKTYSHGMKQKIAIMAALVHNPKVWVLDEPLTGLDPNSIYEVKECMKEHAAAGNIVFFSSHLIDIVSNICDKIVIIKKGKLRAVATVAELEARNIDLEKFYLDIIEADESAELVNIGGDDILNIDNSAVNL